MQLKKLCAVKEVEKKGGVNPPFFLHIIQILFIFTSK
jgi:hypothetical protein